MSQANREIDVEELHRKIDAGEPFVLLDVRRPDEVEVAALPNAVYIPLHELAERLDELDPRVETLVLCHHGVRSLSATIYLENQGFTRVRSVAGGIDRWSTAIDPKVARY